MKNVENGVDKIKSRYPYPPYHQNYTVKYGLPKNHSGYYIYTDGSKTNLGALVLSLWLLTNSTVRYIKLTTNWPNIAQLSKRKCLLFSKQ